MISRVAESCFWMCRYLERGDTVARLTDVNLAFNLDVDLPAGEQWAPLLTAIGVESPFVAQASRKALADGERVREFLTWSDENPCSIRTSLRFARENARRIRETISLEMWETVNHAWTWMNSTEAQRLYERDAPEFYAELREQFLLFHGVALNTMLHEEPFDFMRLGFSLERTAQTARIVLVKHHQVGETLATRETTTDAAQWIALLRSCLGIESFLKRSANVLNGQRVASFLIFDSTFPYSLAHNIDRARNFLERVRKGAPERIGKQAAGELAQLSKIVSGTSIEKVVDSGIDAFLSDVLQRVDRVCTSVANDFFAPVPE